MDIHGPYDAATDKPWFQSPPPLANGRSIAIIGGGIAGLTTGLALQKQGYQVTIFDRGLGPMAQASGNPAAILEPYLTVGDTTEADFYRSALCQALDYYIAIDPEVFLSRGLTKFAKTPSEQHKFAKILLQGHLPEELRAENFATKALGVTENLNVSETSVSGLHFPTLGAISPPKIREILAQKLTIESQKNITHIIHDQQWQLYQRGKICHAADSVVICGGPQSHHFSETTPLPLAVIRGQITLLDGEDYPAAPHDILCGQGYVIPPFMRQGSKIMIIGASFGPEGTDISLRAEDDQENMKNAEILWPGISQRTITGRRCSLRAYSPDHLPICGPVPDFTKYSTAYAALRHGPKHQAFPPASYQPNLYMVTGLGARGFLTAPLLSNMITALIAGTPLPAAPHVAEMLHPGRFMIRALIKGLIRSEA